MANIEKRSENSYRITVSCGRSVDGKKLRKHRTISLDPGMTERQKQNKLDEEIARFKKEVKDGQYLDGETITFAAFVQIWLKNYAIKQLAPGTLNPYKTRLEKRILPALGHIKLAKLQPHHLMEFLNKLADEGARLDPLYMPSKSLVKRLEKLKTAEIARLSNLTFKTAQNLKRGYPAKYNTAQKLCSAFGLNIKKDFIRKNEKKLSDKTIRHHHGLICTILATAVKWNLISSNPAIHVDLGKKVKYKPNYYDDKQIIIMLAALEDEPLCYKTMIFLTVDTGMRTGEITGLKWTDIDFEKKIVTVRQQRQYVNGFGTIERDPKTESGFRTITLSEKVVDLLQQHKRQQLENKLRHGSAWKQGETDIVFVHDDGTPIHPHYPYKWFTAFLIRHDLPKLTYHQLRHTNASLLISADLDIVTLSARLGHSNKNITLNVYAHVINSKEAQVASKMDMFYSQLPERSNQKS